MNKRSIPCSSTIRKIGRIMRQMPTVIIDTSFSVLESLFLRNHQSRQFQYCRRPIDQSDSHSHCNCSKNEDIYKYDSPAIYYRGSHILSFKLRNETWVE